MNETNPLNYGILYVDDEATSLKYFREMFEDIAPIFTATSAEEGFEVLRERGDGIGIVLSDQRMPGECGIDFLSRVEQEDPRPLRMLVTAHADLSRAVDALNNGLLYAYLSKPWDPEDLGMRISCALEHFNLATEKERLLQEKSAAFNQLLMADRAASIGILAAGLNHHLRNALTVIRSFHDLLPYQLQEEFGRAPKDSSYFVESYDEAKLQMKGLTRMLSSLWDSANGAEVVVEQGLDMEAIFLDAADAVLGLDDTISFQLSSEEDTPRFAADPQKMAHMARLLLQEARSNTRGDGTVEIEISRGYDSHAKVESLHVSCIDNGKPIGDGDLSRLFDPFYVRPHQPEEYGTNLLACYLTIYHHGGTIEAERLEEEGKNAIRFEIPVSSAQKIDEEGSRLIIEEAKRMSATSRVALSS